jgi:hypothetical protein
VGPGADVDRERYEAASPEQRHEMSTRAAVRTFDGRVYASHYSALTLMLLPVFGAPLGHIHVARAVDALSRRRSGLSIHTAYGNGAGRVIGGTPSVNPVLAILGAAMTCGIDTESWRLMPHWPATRPRWTTSRPGWTNSRGIAM